MKTKSAFRSAFFRPRVLITFCAIGVLLALLAFALYPGGTARAQGAQQNQPAGQARPLTPEEAKRLIEGLKPLVNQSTEGLVQVHHADGSVSVDLQGRFMNVTVAKEEANGTISQSCVDNLASAAAFFGINPKQLGPAKPAPRSKTRPDPKQPENR